MHADLLGKGGTQNHSVMLQNIIVEVLRGETHIATKRFLNPPKQAAVIEQKLKAAGYEGVLEHDDVIYTGEDSLGQGSYTLQVSEAAGGKSVRGHHIWSRLPLPERLSPGPYGSLRPLLRSADAVVRLPSLVVCSGL